MTLIRHHSAPDLPRNVVDELDLAAPSLHVAAWFSHCRRSTVVDGNSQPITRSQDPACRVTDRRLGGNPFCLTPQRPLKQSNQGIGRPTFLLNL